MNENPAAIILLKDIEPDPNAEICLLVKKNQLTNTPTPPWQLVHLVRIRNFGELNILNKNYVYHFRDLETALQIIKDRTNATHSLFMNGNDWQAIVTGNLNPALLQDKIAADLAGLQLQPVDITDLIFTHGKFSAVELSLRH